MKIYLDNCALGRLFDEQTQPRVRAEADAMRSILQQVENGFAEWVGSVVLTEEIARNPNRVRRLSTQLLLSRTSQVLQSTPGIMDRGTELQLYGFTAADAQHLAFAEAAGADALITTDDRLIRRFERLVEQSHLAAFGPAVLNPLDWLGRLDR